MTICFDRRSMGRRQVIVLLDTHSWIWFLNADPKLGCKAKIRSRRQPDWVRPSFPQLACGKSPCLSQEADYRCLAISANGWSFIFPAQDFPSIRFRLQLLSGVAACPPIHMVIRRIASLSRPRATWMRFSSRGIRKSCPMPRQATSRCSMPVRDRHPLAGSYRAGSVFRSCDRKASIPSSPRSPP